MSGSYDVRSYLKDYYDDNVYFNNPVDYLSNLNDDHYLPLLRKADAIMIMSGQGNYEAPERSRTLSDILQLQRDSAYAGSLGTRRGPRLAVVAEDAAVRVRKSFLRARERVAVQPMKHGYEQTVTAQ